MSQEYIAELNAKLEAANERIGQLEATVDFALDMIKGGFVVTATQTLMLSQENK